MRDVLIQNFNFCELLCTYVGSEFHNSIQARHKRYLFRRELCEDGFEEDVRNALQPDHGFLHYNTLNPMQGKTNLRDEWRARPGTIQEET